MRDLGAQALPVVSRGPASLGVEALRELDRRKGDKRLAKRLAREAAEAAEQQRQLERRHERRVQRREQARREAYARWPRQAVVTVGAAGATVPLALYEPGGLVVAAAGVALLAGTRLLKSFTDLRRPPVPPLELPSSLRRVPTAAPPSSESVAFPAVRRLEHVRAELGRLLPLVSSAGRAVADEAWAAASEADVALRWQAARLAAVEPHRGADPELLGVLELGVQQQERLVVAVADLVAASADPLARSRLQDATDALHGLAAGLREVR